MGGATSAAADVVGIEHYSQWTLDNVKHAWTLAENHRVNRGDTFIHLSRFAFWEVRAASARTVAAVRRMRARVSATRSLRWRAIIHMQT